MMTKIGMLCACMLAACGGGGSRAANPPAQPQPAESERSKVPVAETASYEPPPPIAAPARPEAPKPIPEETPADTDPMAPDPAQAAAAPPVEPKAAPMAAMAELKSIKDDTSFGTITFERRDDGKIVISGQFTGLKPGAKHAIYIHEKGDCGNKGKAAGGHLNPTKAKHGPPESSERHAGDFGNLTVDDSGAAVFAMETDSLTMEADRGDSILNRAVIIHAKKDDKKGDAGPALACGVILMRE
jgi:Cu-Zn family superoxide dismutase